MGRKIGKKKVGLALGGGAVLGAAHIGVLRALDENEVTISAVSGTSIGALVSAMVAFGNGWEDIQDAVADLNWLDVSGLSLGQYGVLSNKKLGQFVDTFLGESEFEDARLPLSMIATDIATGDKVIMDTGSVSTAVMASTAIPGVFAPVERDGRLLVDGGVLENVPVSPLEELDVDFIISVDLNATFSGKPPDSIVEVLINAFNFMMHTASALQTRKADVRIEPDLSAFNAVDMNQVPDLIEAGYKATIEALG